MSELKKTVVRSVFVVKEKRWITPHYIRIVFSMTDEQAKMFGKIKIGAHNKIFIPQPGTNNITFPEQTELGSGVASAVRTYTTRHIDYGEKELWIDFVAHGDNGPASFWANRAESGSVLGIAMKEGAKPLLPSADGYLLAGDCTAIPVISAMLEQLQNNAGATVILEVFGKDDEIMLSSAANVKIEWVHNPHPEQGSGLANVVRKRLNPVGKFFVFAAAEFDTIKNLKTYFKEELAWSTDDYSLISYWKKGHSEEESTLERQKKRSD